MEVKAKLRYARVGTYKTRLVANLVRGMDVNEAIRALTFMKQKPAEMIKKLIESAVANAEDKKVIDVDNLYIKTITVDQGPAFKRFQPRAQGRAFMIKKKQSHINLVLDER
ncbi:MAG: 50S ribosomal protein L22 [Bdellovibrionales bacterium]|nr:50S ribosomal protein L22 [Bdellovibrionales bacterium]